MDVRLKEEIRGYMAEADSKPFDSEELLKRREKIYSKLFDIGLDSFEVFVFYIGDSRMYRNVKKNLESSRNKLIDLMNKDGN